MIVLLYDGNPSSAESICMNSSPPSAAYMRQWIGSALVQIMACRLSAPSHYLNQCWIIVNWTFGDRLQWNFDKNTNFFIHKNASENIVCKMVSILSRGRWVNSLWPSDAIRWQGTESTLAQVMACCLMAPSHYLNQCWLIISKVLWHSSEGDILRRSEDTNQ